MAESLAPIVAQHYNKIEEKGLDVRKQCRIVFMRNFNNWIKSMLIREFCDKNKDNEEIKVLDIGAGKGGDLMKWKKGNISYLVCADIAETSVEQCNERYNEMKQRHKKQRERGRCFDAEFIVADCTKDRLKDKYKNPDIQFDIVSCQFAFHYCFESITQAKTMLQNISECLKPGGFFIGTLPDAYDIMRRLEETDGCVFGNDVYTVTFPSKEQPSIFGAKYDFHLEDCVDCPEFLVYFPVFLKLAEEFDLDLLYCKRFEDYFKEKLLLKDGMFLLQRMLALETYPPNSASKALMGCDDEYYFAKQEIKSLLSNNERNEQVGTLSQSEWEVICMYCVFAFVKKGTDDD